MRALVTGAAGFIAARQYISAYVAETLLPLRIPFQRMNGIQGEGGDARYSTVTDLARLRGLSTS